MTEQQHRDPCRCGHQAEHHDHEAEADAEADTSCIQCGPALCPTYRPAPDLGALMRPRE